MFRYLVNDGVITGNQLCLALFAQGVLAQDPQAIAALETGDSSLAFAFIKEKISNIELTPAQLALGSLYGRLRCHRRAHRGGPGSCDLPSYDNNQMLGKRGRRPTLPSSRTDLSRPLYNNATQALKAPGSTFKPITAVAAPGGGCDLNNGYH